MLTNFAEHQILLSPMRIEYFHWSYDPLPVPLPLHNKTRLCVGHPRASVEGDEHESHRSRWGRH